MIQPHEQQAKELLSRRLKCAKIFERIYWRADFPGKHRIDFNPSLDECSLTLIDDCGASRAIIRDLDCYVNTLSARFIYRRIGDALDECASK